MRGASMPPTTRSRSAPPRRSWRTSARATSKARSRPATFTSTTGARLTDRAHVQLGLDLLVELGYVAAARSGATKSVYEPVPFLRFDEAFGERGGRPTVTYEVNPRAL